MCGILACINHGGDLDHGLDDISQRGPDMKRSIHLPSADVYLGFTRLSINDLSERGMQPMATEDRTIHMVCNGEIYNFKELAHKYALPLESKSDCEVVLRLYAKLSKEDFGAFVRELDGEFAFVLFDETKKMMFAARDRYGVRPLFVGVTSAFGVAFASEMKAMVSFCTQIEQVVPGMYVEVDTQNKVRHVSYYDIYDRTFNTDSMTTIYETINHTFRNAVQKRLISDRPICCLLSGGLDSSLVSALVASHFPPYTIHTFSIGFEGSPDLEYAQLVADHIKSVHHTVQVDEREFISNLESTISVIESYDTTTVRASVGNYLVAKYIAEHTENKVVFNGDYSDEVCGGYKYFKNAPDDDAFDAECRRLVHDICYFDSLRSDRTISSQGLEARVPFSDKEFVSYYLSIPPKLRNVPDKYILRKAFEKDDLLPASVLWRQKEAFSDGVSKSDKSWHHTIQAHIDGLVSDETFEKEKTAFVHNPPMLKESFYYRTVFNKQYKAYQKSIPYFWLPKWSKGDVIDPSARELI